MNATVDEVREALGGLSAADKIRLQKYAQLRVASIGRLGGRRTWEDLLHEAIVAALDGRRRWDPSKVDLNGFLAGAMRSISSHWAEQQQKRRTHLDSELRADDTEEGPIGAARSANPDPERLATAKQMLEKLKKVFEDDPVVLCIMEGVLEEMTGPELQEALSISKKEYETAMKRLRRNARRAASGEAGHA